MKSNTVHASFIPPLIMRSCGSIYIMQRYFGSRRSGLRLVAELQSDITEQSDITAHIANDAESAQTMLYKMLYKYLNVTDGCCE